MNISKGAQNANNAKDPGKLDSFMQKSMDLKEKDTKKELADMKDQLKTVNGLRNQLKSM
jgi:hypothetical protein